MSDRTCALLGFMGAGKTTAGRVVSAALGRRFLDLDRQVELALGMTVAEVFEKRGEDAFRAAEASVLGTLLEPDCVVALGGGVVMDPAAWRLLQERTLTIWLDAPVEVLWQRAAAEPGRPLTSSYEQFAALLATRLPRYAEADHRVNAGRPLAEVVDEVVLLCAG